MEKKYSIALVDELINVFKKAGQLSIELRNKGLIKKTKSDDTPVTNGDIEVNNILVNEIKRLTPKYPIVSEETLENKFEKNLKNFWLIDPIDGTYDYINNKDEFTLNAALIVDKSPFLGIVYAPSKKRLFCPHIFPTCLGDNLYFFAICPYVFVCPKKNVAPGNL